MKICCMIPALNERGNLEELVEKLTTTLRKEKVVYFLLFIIQGQDGSLSLIKKLQTQYKHIDFIFFRKALGVGKAYRVGFKQMMRKLRCYTHILTLDADLNHNPTELPRFLKVARETHADIIIGSRFIHGGKFQDKRLWKRTVSLCTNWLITKLLGIPIRDATSGFRLIKRRVIEELVNHLSETGYPFYMEFILRAHQRKFRMREIAITYIPRKWGVSKMSKIRTFFDYLGFIPSLVTRF